MSKSTREKEVINLVMRQTDYTEEQAKDKLKQWNNNYINVIKEYLNPEFNTTKKETKPKTLNQQMLGEIRSFMDDVYIKFENRKRYNQYINVLNQARQEAAAKKNEEEEVKGGEEVSKRRGRRSSSLIIFFIKM
jgi:NACalpha-BTF3-like transcription factor